MDRTLPSEAITHPGTTASSAVNAATGIKPRSARPASTSVAHTEGRVYRTSYRPASRSRSGECSKSHINGAGFKKSMAATRSFRSKDTSIR